MEREGLAEKNHVYCCIEETESAVFLHADNILRSNAWIPQQAPLPVKGSFCKGILSRLSLPAGEASTATNSPLANLLLVAELSRYIKSK